MVQSANFIFFAECEVDLLKNTNGAPEADVRLRYFLIFNLLLLAPADLQHSLFEQIKSLIPAHVSLVEEISDVLCISTDSAYRRIRGEKPISLEEVQKLASRFQFSLDQFLHLQTDAFIFSGNLASAGTFNFENWLANVLQQMQYIAGFKEVHTYHLTKDIPFYASFHFPELGAFKSFFWRKSILHYDEMRGQKFSLAKTEPQHLDTGKKIIAAYNQFPTVEIWNIENINSTIRQIEFYKETKVFEQTEDIQCLYDKIGLLLNHFERQAELGVKLEVNGEPKPGAGAYTMLVNEVALGDNTFHAVLDGKMITFLNHSIINYIFTKDERFTLYIQDMIENVIRKSTQISNTNEKDRSRFFTRLRDKLKLSARL